MIISAPFRENNPRLRAVGTIVGIGLLILLTALWRVQVLHGEHYGNKQDVQSLRDALTANGRTIWDNVKDAPRYDLEGGKRVIRPLDDPFKAKAGIAVLRGNLAPDGAVIKPSAATPALMQHRGRAVVFLRSRTRTKSCTNASSCVTPTRAAYTAAIRAA